jgi:galactoside O-acetyltransferase
MDISQRLKDFFFVTMRIWKYRLLSDCRKVSGEPKRFQPLLLKGNGKISFGKDVQIGVIASPNFYSHYAYLEARDEKSEIIIGNNVALNNGFSATAFTKITIGDNVLAGVNCSIIDTDAHHSDPAQRRTGIPAAAPVVIGANVFLGSDVTVLKGVTIGRNSIIGNGSVVTADIPENVIAAGSPAKVIRNLPT